MKRATAICQKLKEKVVSDPGACHFDSKALEPRVEMGISVIALSNACPSLVNFVFPPCWIIAINATTDRATRGRKKWSTVKLLVDQNAQRRRELHGGLLTIKFVPISKVYICSAGRAKRLSGVSKFPQFLSFFPVIIVTLFRLFFSTFLVSFALVLPPHPATDPIAPPIIFLAQFLPNTLGVKALIVHGFMFFVVLFNSRM